MTHTDTMPASSLVVANDVPHDMTTRRDNKSPIPALCVDGSLNPDGFLAENVRALLPVLAGAFISEVTLTFSGTEHVGDQQSVLFTVDGDREGIDEATFSYCAPVTDEPRTWEETKMTLRAAVGRLVVDYLDAVKIPSNTGGYGDLVIDVDQQTLEMAVYSTGSDTDDRYYCWHEFATDSVN